MKEFVDAPAEELPRLLLVEAGPTYTSAPAFGVDADYGVA
jgi:hypothetical protein